MGGWEFVMTGEQEIFQHAEEIEIDEARTHVEQEGAFAEHLLVRHEALREAGEQILLIAPPRVDAAASELAFLEPQIIQTRGGGDELFVTRVVQFKREPLHVVFNVTPEDCLQAAEFVREQAELQFESRYFAITCDCSSVSKITVRPSRTIGTW